MLAVYAVSEGAVNCWSACWHLHLGTKTCHVEVCLRSTGFEGLSGCRVVGSVRGIGRMWMWFEKAASALRTEAFVRTPLRLASEQRHLKMNHSKRPFMLYLCIYVRCKVIDERILMNGFVNRMRSCPSPPPSTPYHDHQVQGY